MAAADAVTVHERQAKALTHQPVKFGLIGFRGQSMARHEFGSTPLLENRRKALAAICRVTAHERQAKALTHQPVKFGLIGFRGQSMAGHEFKSTRLLENRRKALPAACYVTDHERHANAIPRSPVKFGLIGFRGQSMARHEFGSTPFLENRRKALVAADTVTAHDLRTKALTHQPVK